MRAGRLGQGPGQRPGRGSGAGGVLDAGAREPIIEATGESSPRGGELGYAVIGAPSPAVRLAGLLAAFIPSGVPRPGWPGGMGRFGLFWACLDGSERVWLAAGMLTSGGRTVRCLELRDGRLALWRRGCEGGECLAAPAPALWRQACGGAAGVVVLPGVPGCQDALVAGDEQRCGE